MTRPNRDLRMSPTLGVAMLALLASCLSPVFSQRPADERSEATIVVDSVKPGPANDGAFLEYYGLTRADHARITRIVPNIRRTVPIRYSSREARAGREATDILLRGTVPAYGEAGRIDVRRGRFLLEKDQKRSNNVAVISPSVARSLFGFKDPIGKNILIGREFFLVVGIATERGWPDADLVYIPISAMQWRLGDVEIDFGEGGRISEQYELSRIEVSVKDAKRIRETAESIRRVLRAYHKKDDYSVTIHESKNAR